MITFEKIFNKVIEHEGYYAHVAGDKGGETYMGIARNLHPYWEGWAIVDSIKMKYGGRLMRNFQIQDEKLTEMVQAFYYGTFWKGNNIHKMLDENLQYIVFDWCVNSGRNGAKGLQKVLNSTYSKNLVVDGVIGDKTLDAVSDIDPFELFMAIKEARVAYYHAIADSGQNRKFLAGWLKRINSINYAA